jgi:hypothetical protein
VRTVGVTYDYMGPGDLAAYTGSGPSYFVGESGDTVVRVDSSRVFVPMLEVSGPDKAVISGHVERLTAAVAECSGAEEVLVAVRSCYFVQGIIGFTWSLVCGIAAIGGAAHGVIAPRDRFLPTRVDLDMVAVREVMES